MSESLEADSTEDPITWTQPPREDTDRFRQSFQCPLEHQSIKKGTCIPQSAPESSKNRLVFSSFGDNGTTASVNAYGHIMQISRFLGFGRSGFYCVDLAHVPEPYMVELRNRKLTSLCESPDKGMRLEIFGQSEDPWDFASVKPTVEFLYDRWPRFTFDKPKISKLSVQYFCHSGTIFQRYLLRCRSTSPSIPQLQELRVNADLLIRDLDFVDGMNGFNEGDDGYCHRTGPHDRSIIVTHDLQSASIDSTHEDEETIEDPNVRPKYQPAGNRKEPKFVGLVITVFAKGSAQTIKRDPYDQCAYNVILDEEHRREFQTSGSLEITLAYRLQMMAEDEPWESSLIPAKHLHEMGKKFSSEAYDSYNSAKRVQFSSHPHLDFIVRRNLEHVLSVCRIPIPASPIWGDATENTEYCEGIPVALTCGDMSGHRLTSTTSLYVQYLGLCGNSLTLTSFAFQFLLSMFKYLRGILNKGHPLDHSSTPDECSCKPRSDERCNGCKTFEDYVQSLQARIRDTCEAHLTWVFQKTGSSKDLFSPHYWTTGKSIEGWEENYYLSYRPLTDTPLQVIKAGDFDKIVGCMESGVHERNLRERIRTWIRIMDGGDSRGKYMVPRIREKNKKFHLADHARIYEALKATEDLSMENELQPDSVERKTGGEYVSKSYDSATFRKNVVKRFTTEDPVSKQRLLATSRTSSETRFLLHSRDTALFYAMESGFFDITQHKEVKSKQQRGDSWKRMIEVWRNTVDTQVNFEENQSYDWENPLWYALQLLVGSKKRRISNLPVEESLAMCLKTLLSISSPNGLFPGLLDDAKNPMPFEDELDRDNYWHVVFEIPQLLWSYGRAYLEATSTAKKAHRSNTEHPDQQILDSTRTKAEDTSSGAPGPVKDGWRPSQFFKKKIPFSNFNNLIDRKGIVDIQDDWLLPGPNSLDFQVEPNFLEFQRPVNRIRGANTESGEGKFEKDHGVIQQAGKWYEAKGFSDNKNFKGAVVDVPGRARKIEGEGKINLSKIQLMRNSEFLSVLGAIRTVEEAKKRLIWLRGGDRQTALLSYLGSPLPEREKVSSFFDKHASYEKNFFDSATASLNEWETELHLSFFHLDNVIWRDGSQIPRASFVTVVERKGIPITVGRTAMSFRFVGDFFDRYWTCHFLEDNPRGSGTSTAEDDQIPLFTLDHNLFDEMDDGDKKKHPWQQRKVLELVLMDEILHEMASSAKKILDWARESVLRPAKSEDLDGHRKQICETTTPIGSPLHRSLDLGDPFKVMASIPLNPLAETLQGSFQSLQQKGSDSYFSINERWRIFEQILQAVEEDLDENLERIKEWRSRESDRGLERPRWTSNDERRYRPTITRLSVSTKRRIRDLERVKQNIQAFRETLTGRLTAIRDDISFRGSENINLFTYVTVVFLPLGFATGIFSMSQSPSRNTLIHMVITAIISLIVTIGALVNAKILDKEVVEPAIKTLRFISEPVLLCLIKVCKYLPNRLLLERKMGGWFVIKFKETQPEHTGNTSSLGARATLPSPPPDQRLGSTTPRELENGSGTS